MKLTKGTQTVLAIVGGIALLGFLARRQVAAGFEAVSEINQGTPFEGSGPLGGLGRAADETVELITEPFGLENPLSTLGSAIGEFFSGSFFDRRTVDDLTQQ